MTFGKPMFAPGSIHLSQSQPPEVEKRGPFKITVLDLATGSEDVMEGRFFSLSCCDGPFHAFRANGPETDPTEAQIALEAPPLRTRSYGSVATLVMMLTLLLGEVLRLSPYRIGPVAVAQMLEPAVTSILRSMLYHVEV